MGRRKRKKLKKRAPKGKFRRAILGLGLLFGFGLVFVIFFNPWVWRLDLRAELEKSKITSLVYDSKGEPVVALYAKNRLWTPLGVIPLQLQQAYVATEDSRFYLHKGIDLRGIFRALYQDVKTRSKVQGGSTITQQLVKNLFFTQEKQFGRKVMEMAYAIRIEQQYSKKQILELYLNHIYLGHGAWGVESAARVYFGKSVRDLSLDESALLAGLAKSPEYYSAFRNPRAALNRRNLVLRLMQKAGYIDAMQVKVYSKKSLRVLKAPGNTYVGAYFVDYILDKLRRETGFNEAYLRTSGLKIYTTMNRRVQKAAEAVIGGMPLGYTDAQGVGQPQGALVALDPKNGAILGMVGGRRFSGAEKNRSYQLLRQPGSAIKPFVYAVALENGYGKTTKVQDQPLTIMVNGQPWQPQNYDNKYRGWITLQEALEESVNTVAIELVRKLGVESVFSMARRMGLDSLVGEGAVNDRGLAPLALGGLTTGVSLLELTGAYTAFANRGIHSRPFGIIGVYSRKGILLLRSSVLYKRIIRPETADTLTEMMVGVITHGTGKRARIPARAAGKTGTTNENTNGWFIGYTSDLLAGIWIGNDRANQPLVVHGTPWGSGKAAEIWSSFMRRVL